MGTLSSLQGIIEESLANPTRLYGLSPANYQAVMNTLPSLRSSSGTLNRDKLSDPIPPELECLVELSYQG